MFAGHLGVALAAARAEPRLNPGLLAGAALLLDGLLWGFVLLGWEVVLIPADFASTHQPQFVFPWSHGLLASLGWSALAGAAVAWWGGGRAVGGGPAAGGRAVPGAWSLPGRWRIGLLVAGVVFSHWLLDALVHRPELPLAGAGSLPLGAGLWDHMPLALAVEAALALAGTLAFVHRAGLPRGRALGLLLLMAAVLGATVAGMTVAPPPPSAAAMAASSLGSIALVVVLVGVLGRGARAGGGRAAG